MYRSSDTTRGESPVSVIGAGIAGAWQALLFAQAGREVTLHERSSEAMTQSTSYWAGGMLAPWTLGHFADIWGVGVVMALPLAGTCMVLVLVLLIWLEAKIRLG